MTGRRRLPRPSRRRFIVLEIRVWIGGEEKRVTFGRWVTRTTGRPKARPRSRAYRGAEAGA